MSLEKQFITYRDKENALNKRVAGEQMSAPVDAGTQFARIIMKACAYDLHRDIRHRRSFIVRWMI